METATDSEIRGKWTAFEAKMLDCVSNAFQAVGTGPLMEDYIYWRLSLGLDDVVRRPQRFIEALKSVFGEAGAAVYEYKLVSEIQKEFELVQAPVKEGQARRRGPGELLKGAVAAARIASLHEPPRH